MFSGWFTTCVGAALLTWQRMTLCLAYREIPDHPTPDACTGCCTQEASPLCSLLLSHILLARNNESRTYHIEMTLEVWASCWLLKLADSVQDMR